MEREKIRGVVLVIFSVLTAVTNLILMTTILCTRQLRLSSKYIIVLVLSTCDLIIGLVQYPIITYLIFTADIQNGNSNCDLQNAAYIYVVYIFVTLRMSLMIALLIDFSLSLMIRDVKLLFKVSLSMIACSIVASFVLVFPMVHTESSGCLWQVLDYRGLNVSTYFPQMIVIVFLAVTIGYVYYYHRVQLPNFIPENPASPIDVFIAANILVWFAFPFIVYLVTPWSAKCNGFECGIDMRALFICMQLFENSQTFVIPLVWLCNSKMRTYSKCYRCMFPARNEAFTALELNHNPSESHLRL